MQLPAASGLGVQRGMPAPAFAIGAAAAASRDPRRVAEGFEALFLHQLLEPLQRSAAALFGAGGEGSTFAGLFRQVLADELARSRPLGIAQRIEEALRRATPAPPQPGGAPSPAAPQPRSEVTA